MSSQYDYLYKVIFIGDSKRANLVYHIEYFMIPLTLLILLQLVLIL